MRVLSCVTAVAWLLTLGEPCFRPPVCGAEAQHQCCCADHGECTCHLESHRAAAAPPLAAAQVSRDQQSLTAVESCVLVAMRADSAALARTLAGPAAPSPPAYLSSRAFRC